MSTIQIQLLSKLSPQKLCTCFWNYSKFSPKKTYFDSIFKYIVPKYNLLQKRSTQTLSGSDVANVQESTGKFTSLAHGKQIFYREWTSNTEENKKRAIVLMTHGFGSHSGRFKVIADHFTKHGYIMASNDDVGHGMSEGRRGYVKTFHHYVDDIVQLAELKKKESPNLPIFLLGHSMGGLVAVITALFHPNVFNGIISSSAPLTVNKRIVTPSKYALVKISAKLLPYLVVAKFDNTRISKDPNVVKGITDDDLCYRGGMTAGWCYAIYDAMIHAIENLKQIKVPLLAIHGGDDFICETQGSKILIEGISSPDRTLKIYDGAYHDIFFEPGVSDMVIKDCFEWIDARIQNDEQNVKELLNCTRI